MITKEISVPTGLDRLNALAAWWGMPHAMESGDVAAQAKRCQVLMIDLNKTFSEASCRQLEALFATDEQLARLLQELLRSRQPQDLMAAQSNIVTTLLESFAAQTKAWADLTQKVCDRCAPMAHETAEETGEQAGRALHTTLQAGAERSARKETGKRVAHA